MKLILPFPVSLNQLYKNARKGRVKTDKYKVWARAAGWELVAQLSKLPKSERLITGKISYSLFPLRFDKRRRDLDNLSKCVLDLLTAHGVIEDDSEVEELYKRWRYSGPEGIAIIINPFVKKEREFNEWW